MDRFHHSSALRGLTVASSWRPDVLEPSGNDDGSLDSWWRPVLNAEVETDL